MGGFNQECTRPFRLIPRRWNNWFIRDRTGLLTCVLGLLTRTHTDSFALLSFLFHSLLLFVFHGRLCMLSC